MTNISIITIGDELLIGQVIDTNSAWMAQELNKSGFWVKRRVAIGDGRSDILKALDEESADSEIILITGGLGPTADDITKPVLCEYFKTSLVINEEALENVKNIFVKILQRPLIERIMGTHRSFDHLQTCYLLGSPRHIRERIAELAAAGLEYLVLTPLDYDLEQLDLWEEEIIRHFR